MRLISQSKEADYIKFAHQALDDAINIFTEFDQDDSGELDKKEIKVMFASLGMKNEVDLEKFVEEEMKKLDKNKDSKVDFDEFVDFYNSLMDLA